MKALVSFAEGDYHFTFERARTRKEGVAGDNLHSVETTKPMGDLKPKTEKKRVLE